MTQWGALLLCSYIALGATSRLTRRNAGRIALAITAVVVGIAMVGYMHGTPTDKYYKDVDAPVYANGVLPLSPSPTSEDVTGVKAATPGNTVTTSVAGGSGG